MTTQKVFWQDPYLTELETTIKSVNDNQITVTNTIFYAFSGGQESDAGTIGGYFVLNAEKNDKEIFYTIANDHQLKTGDVVRMSIDWERRYKLMRLHFAAEMVLELVYQKFEHVEKIGAHIAADKARIDFKCTEKMTAFIAGLQQEVQDIIDSNLEITSAFSNEQNETRYWKISGFAAVPCGGTHLKKTGEVGIISLKRANPGKGKERIQILVENKLNLTENFKKEGVEK